MREMIHSTLEFFVIYMKLWEELMSVQPILSRTKRVMEQVQEAEDSPKFCKENE